MTAPNAITVKQVYLSKHDAPNCKSTHKTINKIMNSKIR